MTFEAQFWVAARIWVWNGGVFCVVENEDVARGRFGPDDVRILRHVSSAVHFSFVIYPDLDVDFA